MKLYSSTACHIGMYPEEAKEYTECTPYKVHLQESSEMMEIYVLSTNVRDQIIIFSKSLKSV